MEALFQNKTIIEVEGYQNIAYVLNDNDLFLLTEYKVLNNQSKIRFLKCAKLLYNGKIKLFYFTDGLKSLSSIMSVINGDQFLNIVANLINTVMSIQENGFLDCGNLDMAMDKIFIDQTTMTVHLIYIPVKVPKKDNLIFENELRVNLVKLINTFPNVCSEKVSHFCGDLSNGMLSLAELYKRVCAECENTYSHNTNTQPVMKFVSTQSTSPMEFKINKPEYFIGKSAEKVDGVVLYADAVSRVHCKIIYQSGAYGIVDLQSANGTFINQRRIEANRMIPIKDGDIVRLANKEFLVQIMK